MCVRERKRKREREKESERERMCEYAEASVWHRILYCRELLCPEAPSCTQLYPTLHTPQYPRITTHFMDLTL